MSLVEELEKKLCGGKFRLLNEKMYKNKGITKDEARKYHLYYSEQAKKWPQHPTKLVIEKIQDTTPDARIADLGCGDAELARTFKNVSSFDRHPVSDKIVRAELDSVPVEDGTFDVAVHSLSLMANYISKIVKETNRVLRIGGVWYIAEIRSRIKSNRLAS